MNKPNTKDGYSPNEVSRVQAACRYVCQHLGSLSEHVTIVGGLVPSLIVPQGSLPEPAERHYGTMDIDLGLILGHTAPDRLEQTRQLLRTLGFEADKQHAEMRFRLIDEGKTEIVVDLICITDSESHDVPAGSLPEIVPRIARQIALAFQDRVEVRLHGPTLAGDAADCVAYVCGPGAFVIIKALTFANRHENKDAYDLYYILQNYRGGPAGVFSRLAPLLRTREGQEAIDVLQNDFADHDGTGPKAVAGFLTNGLDDDIQADVVTATINLLQMCGLGDA